MITAIVRFKLPPTVKLADAAELFKGTAPKYRQLPGARAQVLPLQQ